MPNAYVIKAYYYEGGMRQSQSGIVDSLKEGYARIGWSAGDADDLRILRDKIGRGEVLTPVEQEAARTMRFLTAIGPGDYLVYPHQPEANHFVVAQVLDGAEGEYQYLPMTQAIQEDFRSARGCMLRTPVPIPYNDSYVRPRLLAKLGLQGRLYRLNAVDELEEAVRMALERPPAEVRPGANIQLRLGRILDELSPDLMRHFHDEFPRHDLSWLCEAMFRELGYGVINQEGAHEYGSDLIVSLRDELLPRELRIGVQVKSYENSVELSTLQADLQPLLDGWERNALDFGVLLTTGFCVPDCHAHIENHNTDNANASRQLVLLDGSRVGTLFARTLGAIRR